MSRCVASLADEPLPVTDPVDGTAGVASAPLAPLIDALTRSAHDEVDALLQAIDASEPADSPIRGRAHALASHSLYRRSRLDDAARSAACALEIGRGCNDPLARAEGLLAWARIEWAAGNLNEALEHLDIAAQLRVGDDRTLTHLNNLLGLVHADLGHLETSESFLRVAADAARRDGNADLQMVVLTNLAGRLLARGEQALREGRADPEAWAELDRCVDDAEYLGTHAGMGLALPHILVAHGASLFHRGRIDEALAVFTRQRQIVDRYPDRSSLPHAALTLARLHLQRDDLPAARQVLQEGIREAEALRARAREANLHREASLLEERAERYREALAHHRRFHDLREACALESAQRKAMALGVRLQTERALREAQDERRRSQELAASNDRLREQADVLSRAAFVDPLTGLANRRRWDQRAPWMTAWAIEQRRPLAIALLDVDHFKQVNDRFSHGVGDLVLRTLGQLLTTHFRDGDLCARYGGEEFALALPEADAAGALSVCQRLLARVQQHPWQAIHPELRVTISLGLVSVHELDDPRQALERADQRLYAAKRAGRNRVVAQDPVGQAC